ncbi:hypothetical protein [Dokdonella sp.]|uniref:hypothetical protein n=1 Tax=Dokdonella sp. TaxID=2291710 RepID=UPI003528EA27
MPMRLRDHMREMKVTDEAGNSVPLVSEERQLAEARLPSPPPLPPDLRWPVLRHRPCDRIATGLPFDQARATLGAHQFASLALLFSVVCALFD